MTPRRVVSLVPSLTETLFALGAGDAVVGITDFCIFPPDLEVPRVGGTKNPRIDEIRALAPDLVYMNIEENLRRHAESTPAIATALNPHIGYDRATEIVKEAVASQRTIREVAIEKGVDEETLDKALDLLPMARPHDHVAS